MLRPILQALFLWISFGALLFGGAGRLDWTAAWVWLVLYAGFIVAGFALFDPELIAERSNPGEGSKRWDVWLASTGFVFLFPATLLVAGVDAGRLGASPPTPTAVRIAALAIFAAGHGFAFWAMIENRFFATFVRIQRERGHEVVRSGPYGYVRHPGYAGMLVSAIALPLALESLWAFVPTTIGIALFVVRTAKEDATLAQELPGYRDYQHQVRSRLVPGVW